MDTTENTNKSTTKKRTSKNVAKPEIVLSVSTEDALANFLGNRTSMGVTERTIANYTYFLSRFVRFMHARDANCLDDISHELIDEFYNVVRNGTDLTDDARAEPREDRYVNIYAREIKTFLRYCKASAWITEIPVITMPKISKKKLCVLSIEEVEKVLDACKRTRDKALILLTVDCGLRLSEILQLNWADLNLRTGKIEVLHGKGDKYRPVAIGTRTMKEIMKFRASQNAINPELLAKDAPIFPTITGERFSYWGLSEVFSRISERSGVYFTAHALRRTFAKLSLLSGMPITAIQELMGHAYVETTRDYIQQLDDKYALDNHAKYGVVDHMIFKKK